MRQRCVTLAGMLTWSVLFFGTAAAFSADAPSGTTEFYRWEYFQEIELPAELTDGQLCDVIVSSDVFSHSRIDLGDLRLCDATGVVVPFALRVRKPDYRDEKFAVREYNRVKGPDDSVELSLDLGQDERLHNQIELVTSGTDVRRHAILEGGNDGKDWRQMADTQLFNFVLNGRNLNKNRIEYAPSKYRYLRVRVHRDPSLKDDPIDLTEVNVFRQVAIPGEMWTLDAKLSERFPVRTDNRDGSAWDIDLGGDRIPIEKVEVRATEEDFARDYSIAVKGRPDWVRASGENMSDPFMSAEFDAHRGRYLHESEAAGNYEPRATGVWKRRAGEPNKPLAVTFDTEVRASQLRLTITDNANKPLTIENVKIISPARQVTFAYTTRLQGPLRLFYGNYKAEPPQYDFDRNQSAYIVPAPKRLVLGFEKKNPEFVGEPKPLTERAPWLIYAVLGLACAALGLILLKLGRQAITQHDAQQPATA